MTTAPCTITIKERIIQIHAHNGRLIAELLVEGPFETCMNNAIKNKPIEKGTPNLYRGELLPLESDEYLDIDAQQIIIKDGSNPKERVQHENQ